MKREKKRKKILLQAVLFLALSIFAVLFFLISIRRLLFSEAENRLLNLNEIRMHEVETQENNDKLSSEALSQSNLTLSKEHNTTDFDGKVSSFILDATGKVVDSYGELAQEIRDKSDNDLRVVLQGNEIIANRNQLNESVGTVKKYKMPYGESFYGAIHTTQVLETGYILSLVPALVIEEEINGIYRIVVIIAALATVSVVFGYIYSIYKRRTFYRGRNKKGVTDSVTGLPHYQVHKLRTQQLITVEQAAYAYVSFSVDKFYLISELSSRSYCASLLKTIADNLSGLIQEDETFARDHDDLFGMLLRYEDEIKFRQRLVRMFKHAGDVSITANNFCNITFHSGVCVVGVETDIDKVISRAKKVRKKTGTSLANIGIYHSNTLENNNIHRDQIAEDAMKAFKEKRFYVYLQPKYHMDSEGIAGAEALIRWKHEAHGLLTPNVFLPILEEKGMIRQIDFFVLETVCHLISNWIQEGIQPVPVSINLSARQLENTLFVEEVLELVEKYPIPHNMIEFEFPETAIYDKKKELLDAMKQLRKQGFIISIDNFGASASAVYLLNELPVDILKIDKGLIQDLEDEEFSKKDRTIVTHIIAYAKSLNMEVLAEGVETVGQREVLREEACDMLQGYYYQKPMTVEEFQKLLEA